jgi:polyisoprenoid-binding protein YceI
LEATLPVKSIDTGIQMRDDHLMREKYFDQENFPLIRLESQTITRQDDAFLFQGTLTIKGVSKKIAFPFQVQEKGGGLRLQGAFALDRQDYEVGSRSLLLGNEVEVNLSCTLLP